MLLDDYKKAKQEYYKKKAELDKILTPLESKMYKLEARVEKQILKNKIYLPIEELKNYSGCAADITVVYKDRIEDYDFAGYIIKDGILEFDDDHMDRDGSYLTYEKDNRYSKWSDEFGFVDEVEVLGFYNLNLGDGIIPETSLEYLWKIK